MSKGISKIEKNLTILRCPVCMTGFHLSGSSLLCQSGHCFDVNKKGFVNLVPAQKPTKYDTELFMARRRILEAGFYNELTKKLNELCEDAKTVLDAGCGDGFFTQALSAGTVIGLDLAKEAIQRAAGTDGNALFIVGDLTRLPFKDESFDTILNILSPAHYPEFRRVLKPNGRLIKVIPDSEYLREVRSLADKEDYSNAQVKEHFSKNVRTASVCSVRSLLPVSIEQAADIVKMTPMTFSVNTESLNKDKLKEITISLEILVGEL